MTGVQTVTRTVPTRLSRQSQKRRKYRQGGVEGGGRKRGAWSTRADFFVCNAVDFCFQIRYIQKSSSSLLCCPSNAFGNQPYVRKSTLISPVRLSVTSTPSASRASRCRCAPSVPGPRELIVPEDAITLCHGTGGSMLGDNHFRARSFPE